MIRSYLVLSLCFLLCAICLLGCESQLKRRGHNESSDLLQKDSLILNESKKEVVDLADSMGLRQGLWVDSGRYFINYQNYIDDTLHGSYDIYDARTNTIFVKGQYTNGEKAGLWQQFTRNGVLNFEYSQISDTDSIKKITANSNIPPKLCYLKIYDHEKGYFKSEGYTLFTDDPIEDYAKNHGKWIYYDETGDTTQVVIFRLGKEWDKRVIKPEALKKRNSTPF